MLRLLAQREQGYEDIAALMGLSVDEVRARVDEALAELEREGAEAAEPAEPEPEPSAEPGPATPVATSARPPAQPRASAGERPRLGVPRDRGARAAIAAGAVALVAIVVVLIVGGGDDGGDATSATGEVAAAGGQQSAGGSEAAEPTEAILEPVNGSGASGKATFGNLDESLALLVEAEGLKPTGKGQSYAIWLAESPRRMVPVGEISAEDDGTFSTQVPLPVELLAFIANETFTEVAVTLANSSRLEKSVQTATEEEKEPAYTGEAVLRGAITGPIVGAELPEAEDKGE